MSSRATRRLVDALRNTAPEIAVAVFYALTALPHLTTVPRVNVDEPWVMQIADTLRNTGVPTIPMFGLSERFALEPGYSLVMSAWMTVVGSSIYDARLLSVLFGFATIAFTYRLARSLGGRPAGLFTAAFLAADSNFLGTSRTTRHDIMAAAFAAASLCLFVEASKRDRRWLFAVSGASAGAAFVFHVHAVWIFPALALWSFARYGSRMFVRPASYAFVGGLVLALVPLLLYWRTVIAELGWFAGVNTPDLTLRGIAAALASEPGRYAIWYFGLITVPEGNPWLRVFQGAVVAGAVFVVVRLVSRSRTDEATRFPALLIAIAGLCAVITFALLVPSKSPAYFVQLLIPLALLGGYGAAGAVALVVNGRYVLPVTVVAIMCYGASAVWHYYAWFSRLPAFQLEPYETTSRTVAALVPPGRKYVIAYPTFWLPFRDDPESTFYSASAVKPPGFAYDVGSGYGKGYGWRVALTQLTDAPVFVLVDDAHWGPFFAGGSDAAVKWAKFLENNCRVDASAYATPYGTFRSHACGIDAKPPQRPQWIAADGIRWVPGTTVWTPASADRSVWSKYKPATALTAENGRLHISAPQGGGACTDVAAQPGEAYLLTYSSSNAHAADLVSIAHAARLKAKGERSPSDGSLWSPAQADSPAGQVPFVATAGQVRICFYSEAPTDFAIADVKLLILKTIAGPNIP